MLSYMLPRQTSENLAHCASSHAVILSELGQFNAVTGSPFAHFDDLYGTKLNLPIPLPLRRIPMTLSHRIVHVVSIRAKPEMLWVHARRVVAIGTIMQNPPSVWNLSISQNPCDSVGTTRTPLEGAGTVTVPPFRTSPEPATITTLDIRPEAVHLTPTPTYHVVAGSRAELRYSPFQLGGVYVKPCLALDACGVGGDILGKHREDSFLGVAPPAVSAARGHLLTCSIAQDGTE